jgi:hypothetical protein
VALPHCQADAVCPPERVQVQNGTPDGPQVLGGHLDRSGVGGDVIPGEQLYGLGLRVDQVDVRAEVDHPHVIPFTRFACAEYPRRTRWRTRASKRARSSGEVADF